MGNHSVGKAFHVAFNVLDKKIDSMSQAELTEALDAVGNEFRGADAEFDDYTSPEFPLGRAMIKIFDPKIGAPPTDDSDDWWERHYDMVYRPFRERYDFC